MSKEKEQKLQQHGEKRTNTSMAALVDRAIVLQEMYGTTVAADFMKSHEFPVELVLRVLTRKAEHRSMDDQTRRIIRKQIQS